MTQRRVENTRVDFQTFSPVSVKYSEKLWHAPFLSDPFTPGALWPKAKGNFGACGAKGRDLIIAPQHVSHHKF